MSIFVVVTGMWPARPPSQLNTSSGHRDLKLIHRDEKLSQDQPDIGCNFNVILHVGLHCAASPCSSEHQH